MVNIRAMIQQQKTKFREKKLNKIKTQTKIMAEETKARRKLAVAQEERTKQIKIEDQYKKAHPSVLKRLGVGLGQARQGAMKRQAKIKQRSFGGSGSNPTHISVNKSSSPGKTSPFAQPPKGKFKFI